MSEQPSSSPSTNERPIDLPKRERLFGYSVAVVLIIIAFLILYIPRWVVTVKRDGQGQTTETTTSSPNDSTIAIAIFSAGIALLFYTLNGLRLVRFSVAGVTGEGATVSNVVNKVKTPEEIARLPEDDRQLITDDDVVAAFASIPDLSGFDLVRISPRLRPTLLFNGIVTKRQLEELVSSTAILNTLRWLYIRVLRRDQNKPLDPDAVATWGSVLYRLGVTNNVIRALEVQLRASQEYRDKVADGTIKP